MSIKGYYFKYYLFFNNFLNDQLVRNYKKIKLRIKKQYRNIFLYVR